MANIKVALLGYGTVGKGVFQIINQTPNMEIVKILEKPEKFDSNYYDLFTSDVDSIMNDPNIDLVVEVLGGYGFAKSCIDKALDAGKHVVTANKEIIALDIDTLTLKAREKNVCLAYEASVGGGIPIIKNLKEIKEVSSISKISGILNGTTNFILTKMFEGKPFNEALKIAQEKGFAESDPTADLEGYDMMRKIAILSDLAWDTLVDINLIDHKGISDISLDMVEHAKNNNKVIKFVCEATLLEEQIKVEVKPKYFDDNHFFASVQNEFNSVILETDPNDQLIYIGKGAGSLPTASAIVSDVVDIINNRYLDNYKNTKKYKVN